MPEMTLQQCLALTLCVVLIRQSAAPACVIIDIAAIVCTKWRRGGRLKIIRSNQKSDSVNQCAWTRV